MRGEEEFCRESYIRGEKLKTTVKIQNDRIFQSSVRIKCDFYYTF